MSNSRAIVYLGFVFLFLSLTTHAADYYWVGNGGSWTDLSHWATSSGGSTKHTVVPTANDDVYFDANSFSSASQTVTITFGAKCRSMNWTGVTNTPKIYSFFDDLEVYGSLIIPSTVTREFFGNVRMKATSGTHNIDLANLPLSAPNNETLYIEGVGGTWNLASGLTIYRVYLSGGTLNTNGQQVTISSLISPGTNTRALTLGSSPISCATWDVQNATGMTVTSGTSTITSTFRFNGKGFTYNNLTISGTVEVYDNNTFNTITLEAGSILKLKEGTTQTISGLTSNGTVGNPVTIKSVTDGVAATLSKSSGSVSISNARIQDNTATGGATFSAPTGSVDLGNNSGWNITPIQPTVQVTSAQFSKVLTTSVVLRWTNGNGAKRIVLAKLSSAVNADPVDNVAYTAGAFGVGTQIGTGNYVVYAGNSDRATITGLTAGSTYFFKVYEFNSNNTNTLIDYLITSPASATTAMLAANAVVISNTPVTTCAGKFYDTGGGSLYNYSNNEDFTQTLTPASAGNKIRLTFTDFFTAGAGDVLSFYDGADTSAPLLGSFSQGSSPGTITATNAAGKLTIKFVSDANIGSTGWVADITCITLDTEPTVAATATSFTNLSGTSLRLNWTKGNGARRIVLAKVGSAVSFVPVDGTEYVSNASFSSGTQLGTGNYVVYNGTGNFVDVTNLSTNTTYHFSIYEYNGANTSSNYRSTGTTANQITPSLAPEPTSAAAAVTLTSKSENALTLSWTNGNGISRVVVAKAGAPVDAVPVDGEYYNATGSFTTGPSLGNGNIVIQSGSGNLAYATNLTPLTTYHFAVYEYNGNGNGVTNYLTTTPAVGSFTTLVAPPTQSSVPQVSNIAFTTLDVSWDPAGAERYLVVVNVNNSTTTIEDGVEYTGNAVFGSGSKVGPSSYVVFVGTGTNVNVTGLQPDTQYSIRIYGYNGSGAGANYNFGGATAFTSTLKQAPKIQASNLTVTNTGPDSVKLSWTRGDGYRSMLVARAGAPVGTNFRDSISLPFSSGGSFGMGMDLGVGTVVYSGTGTTAVVKGLAPNTTYHFAVFEFNDTYVSKDKRSYTFFLKSNPPLASATTLAGRNFFWVGGTGKWTDLSHWATTSGGGIKHASLPISSDDVFFDAASFANDTDTVYFDRPMKVRNMDWSSITKKASFVSIAAPGSSKCWNDVNVYGSLRLSPLMKIDVSSFQFRAPTKSNVVDLAGKTRIGNSCNGTVLFYGYGGEWTVTSGELYVGNFQVYAGKVIATATTLNADAVEFSTYSNTPAELVLGQSRISTSRWTKGSNVSVSGGTIILNGSAQFQTSGATYRKVMLRGTNGAVVEISGGGAIDSLAIDPGREVRFESGKTFTIGQLLANGDSTKTTTLRAKDAGNPFIFSKSTGEVNVNYVIIKDNNATGGAQFNAKNSVGSNVTGWTFTVPPTYTPKKSASSIVFRRVFRNDLKMKWVSGDGLKRIVVMKESTAVDKLPINGSTYTANAAFGLGSNLGNGNFVVYNGDRDSTSVSGLVPGKRYHVAIFEYNEWGGGVKYKVAGYAIASITTVGTSDVLMSNSSVSACNAKFFDEGGRGFYKEFLSLTQTVTPSTPGTKLGVLFSDFAPGPFDSLIVHDGLSTSSPVLAKYHTFGSTPNSIPSTAVVAKNPSGALTFVLKARDSSADEDLHSGWEADLFCVSTIVSEPTIQTSALVVTPSAEQPQQLTVKITKGNGSGRLLIAREGSAVNKFPTDGFFLLANSVFGSGHSLGAGNFVVYSGTDEQVTVTGLRSNTTYHFAAVEYNGGEGSINYLTTAPAIGNGITAVATPTQAATNLTFSQIAPNSMWINFTKGNGSHRMVVMRKGREVDFVPVDNTIYSGSTPFTLGQKVADSTYVMSTTQYEEWLYITNLEPATRYFVKIFEYSAQGSVAKYMTSSAPTGTQVTPVPVLTLSGVNASYCPNEQVKVYFSATGKYRSENKFTLQLSDSLGGFTNPLKLRDTTIFATSGTIVSKIPNNIKGSSLYKIRVITSSPVTVSDVKNLSIVDIPRVSVTVTGETYESSSATNNQWIRDGIEIPGANSRTFTPTGDGIYTVRVTTGTCFNFSDPIIFTGIGDEATSATKVYPNPFASQLVIESSGGGKFYIVDAIGREWVSGVLDTERKVIDTENVPVGVLLVRVQDASGITIRKVVKH